MSTLRIMRYAYLVGWGQFAAEWSLKSWFGGWMVRVIAQAIFFSMLGQLIGSPERVQYLLIGNALIVGVMNAVAITVPASTWDRMDGTYPLLVVAPAGLLASIAGRTSPRLVNGIATSLLAFAVLGPLFQIPIPWPGVLIGIPLVVLTLTSVYCLMLFLGALANYAPNARNLIHNLATMTMMTFCGVNVPVSFWPPALQAIAQCLPITHGLEAIRLLIDRADPIAIAQAAALEGIVGAGWFLITALTIDRMASAGRANGSIEIVA